LEEREVDRRGDLTDRSLCFQGVSLVNHASFAQK
jgi:hypothetical protein